MRHLVAIVLGVVALSSLLASPSLALAPFKKAFAERYEKDASDEFKAVIKKAGCNICHVKGEKKTVRNAYGKALDELIEGSGKDRLKEDKDAVMKEFAEAMEKLECEKIGEGEETWGDLFKAGKLPPSEKAEEK